MNYDEKLSNKVIKDEGQPTYTSLLLTRNKKYR